MAPKGKAKAKASSFGKKVKKKQGKFIGKQLRKEEVPKPQLKNEDGADDGAEADDGDEMGPANVEEENEDGTEHNEDGERTKATAHEELMKRIQEFRKKSKESGPIDKQKVVKMMKEHFSKTQQSSLWQIGDKLIMDSSSSQGKLAWQVLKAKGESAHHKGKTEAKKNMLALCLAFGDQWEKHMAAEIKTIVDSFKKRMLQLVLHLSFM